MPNLLNSLDIIRSCLIYKVVEPVGIKQIGMGAPGNHRRLGIVVVWKIILRNSNIVSLCLVSVILCLEGACIILKMSRNKNLLALICGYDEYSCLI